MRPATNYRCTRIALVSRHGRDARRVPRDWNVLDTIAGPLPARSASEYSGAVCRESTIGEPRLVVGLGWSRRPSVELLERALRSVFLEHGLSLAAVRSLATLDRKAREPVLTALLERLRWPLLLYSAEELSAVRGLSLVSERVLGHVGTPAVAEAAALYGAGASELLLPRRIVREGEVSVTVAVARVPFAPGGEAA